MRPFEHTIVGLDSTLGDALLSLNRSGCQVVLVADEAARIVGLLTDGDVRRAILSGASIRDEVKPFCKRDFTFVGPGARRVDVLDFMIARQINGVPILDDDHRVVGLHLLRDIIGLQDRPNWAVLMVGGRGVRLAPLTNTVPKPMLRVAGRPILEHIVLQLIGAGVRRIFLAINYLGDMIEEYFGDGRRFGCNIHYLREKKPLGTGGALSLLPERPTEPLIVMNGDLVTQANLGDMLDAHESRKARATLGVRRYFHDIPFGCLETDGDRVVAFEEKPTIIRTINAGLYVLDPALVARVPKEQEFTIPELLSDAIRRGETVMAWEVVDDWVDVGQKEQLRVARGETK